VAIINNVKMFITSMRQTAAVHNFTVSRHATPLYLRQTTSKATCLTLIFGLNNHLPWPWKWMPRTYPC